MAAITVNGYVVKNANDWFLQERDMYLSIDSDWNLDPSTPDGLKLASDSEIWASLDEVGLRAYNSKDPNKSSGTELDTLLYLTTGSQRSLGTPSTISSVEAAGVDGTIITAGSRVESSIDGSRWTVDNDVEITDGVANLSITNIELGAVEASIGDISVILDPIAGWQSVLNKSIATPGGDRENDAEVRARRNKSVARAGQNQIDTMISQLLTTENVTDASIPENDTGVDNFNGDGLPANSIAVIVDGGADLDVATAIYKDKSPGVRLYPANEPVIIPVTSEVTGNTKNITFSRPSFVDMVIEVAILNDGSLPGNINELITEAIIDYANGSLDVSGGFNGNGFRIGEDVAAGQLFTPVNSVVGQYGSSYTSGILVNGGFVATIDFNEKSRFTTANITVTVSE